MLYKITYLKCHPQFIFLAYSVFPPPTVLWFCLDWNGQNYRQNKTQKLFENFSFSPEDHYTIMMPLMTHLRPNPIFPSWAITEHKAGPSFRLRSEHIARIFFSFLTTVLSVLPAPAMNFRSTWTFWAAFSWPQWEQESQPRNMSEQRFFWIHNMWLLYTGFCRDETNN